MTTIAPPTSADAQPHSTAPAGPHEHDAPPPGSAPTRAAFQAVGCGDGLERCPWALGAPGTLADHDDAWGTPAGSARELFASLTLELVDSGLARWSQSARHGSWYLHMAGLDPARVALLDEDDVEDLLVNPELIRNRAKIEAVIHNAGVCQDWDLSRWLDIVEEAQIPEPEAPPENALDLPSSSEASRRLSQILRTRGIVLVGPVTAHRWLQRIGRAPGHVAGCFRAGALG
ncbi:DNA-3-methyladenine glycosylase I [Kocuria rhizophila]|uniref:DNA-3-methyladenine glycosylase I n=1 Tax=Kocuria rhizophila TaxID=72000 RepID=UPI001E2ECCB9|nr:DNA-3-methyladenine glycosylase I [Kocuria rhizophila]